VEEQIGADAGKVWSRLNECGPQTVTALGKDLNLKAPELNRALGWLAREGKIGEIRDAKGNVKIGLR
jgi:hypothetical protein